MPQNGILCHEDHRRAPGHHGNGADGGDGLGEVDGEGADGHIQDLVCCIRGGGNEVGGSRAFLDLFGGQTSPIRTFFWVPSLQLRTFWVVCVLATQAWLVVLTLLSLEENDCGLAPSMRADWTPDSPD